MTPRLWEDVSEVQQQAKLKGNVIFSAQGAPQENVGKYFHTKSKNKLSPLLLFFLDFGLKDAFFAPLQLK